MGKGLSHNCIHSKQESLHCFGEIDTKELYTSTRPDVSHLRIFGSVYYCHVPLDKRTKLDPTGEEEDTGWL
jgi:hypothetical protein